jgi:hypothetical protein
VGDLLNMAGAGQRAVQSITNDTSLSVVSINFTSRAFTFTPWVLYIGGPAPTGNNARLIVNAPLTVRGPMVVDYRVASNPLVSIVKVEGAGAGIEIDASQATNPLQTSYPVVLQVAVDSGSRIHFAGTASNRVFFRSNPAGGNAYISRWGAYYGSWQKYEYCDITDIGTPTIAAGPIDMSRNVPEFQMIQCHVDSCGHWSQNGTVGTISAGGGFRLENTTFKNSIDTAATTYGACLLTPPGHPSGTFIIKGCVFDKTVSGQMDYWTIGGPNVADANVFSGDYPFQHMTSGRNPADLFRHNVLHMRRSANTPFVPPCTIEDTYIYVDLVTGDFNHHPCAMSAYYRHDVKRCVWEWTRDDQAGDFIQLPPPTTDLGVFRIEHCIKLPAHDGGGGGSITAGGSATSRTEFEHNTFHLGINGGFHVGETYAGIADMIESVKANIWWDTTARASYFRSSVGFFNAMALDIVLPTEINYNGTFNVISGATSTINAVTNQSVPGMQYVKFSSLPNGNNVIANPQFVQAGAGIRQWDLALGGPGTSANALAELKKKNDLSGYNAAYNLPAFLAFVREKHRPTNPAFANATYPGDPMTVDAAGNPMGGTIGAMAYLSGLPLTTGTVTHVASRPGRIVMNVTDPVGGTSPYAKQWQRATGAGAFGNLTNAAVVEGVGVVGATALRLEDSTVAPDVTYRYRVVYTDAAAESVTSNEVERTAIGEVIPNIAAYDARVPVDAVGIANFMTAMTTIGDLNLTINHDGLSAAIRALQRYPGNAALQTLILENRQWYRDTYVDNAVGEGGTGHVQGYYNHCEGLALDWMINANDESRLALIEVSNNASYATIGDPVAMASEGRSREVAYAIIGHVWSRKAGQGWPRTILNDRVGYAKGHIDQWTHPNIFNSLAASGNYIQPFMMAITMTALIMYLDHIEQEEAEEDETILPQILKMAHWLWDVAWERGNFFGQFPLQIRGTAAEDTGHNTLLNLYHNYTFWWLWQRTGDVIWRDRGAQMFNSGITTTDMNAPKKWNEFVRWSILGVELYENAQPAPSTRPELRVQTVDGLYRWAYGEE